MEQDGATNPHPTVGNRGVGVCHLNWCHTHVETAETDRWLPRVDRRDDAQPVGYVGNHGRLNQHRQLCEHRVVRRDQRLGECEILAVAVLIVRDEPELATTEIKEHLLAAERGCRADADFERCEQVERFEG